MYAFEQNAFKALKSVWNEDSDCLTERLRVYQLQGIKILIANCFDEDGKKSREAKMLKRQFRNYHFILEACKNKIILGVPLSCLIEWQGVVALVKATLPAQAEEAPLSNVLVAIREL